MSKSPQAGIASGQVHLGVLQEEGQFLGHGVQFTRVGIPEEVALWHEEVFEKVLAHTLVQLPHQAQESFAEDLPVVGAGVFLTGPKEHCLRKEDVVSEQASFPTMEVLIFIKTTGLPGPWKGAERLCPEFMTPTQPQWALGLSCWSPVPLC